MSLFFVPSQQTQYGGHRHHHGHSTTHARCGGNVTTTHSPFELVFNNVGGHPFAVFDGEEEYAIQQRENVLRRRQQQAVQEERARQHYAFLRRQAEVERERERELVRRRIQQQHEQRRLEAAMVAAALEKQERQRKAAAAAQRQRREWEARQRQRYYAALMHEQRRREQRAAVEQWEQFAVDGIAGALDFATKFFDALSSSADEEPSKANDDADEPMDNAEAPKQKSVEVQAAPAVDEVEHEDPADVYPEAEEKPVVQVTAPVEQADIPTKKPLFSLPLPANLQQRANIKADDIYVSFDEQSRTIQVRGLWTEDHDETASNHSHTVANSDDGSRGRTRSRSPAKRSRVSDVDEKTGEEIEVAEEQEDADDFVNVTTTLSSNNTVSDGGKLPEGTVRIPVPEGAQVANLRADLTDDGFHLYL